MASKREHIDMKVRDAIERVLRQRMKRHGYRSADIRADVDHDGDPVLRIDVHYDLMPDPLDPTATVGLLSALRDALDEIGETRFPHVRHEFADTQAIASSRKRKRA